MNKRIDVMRKCEHEAVFGGSGTGKSYYVKTRVKQWNRALIWDPDDEYGDIPNIRTCTKASQVIELMSASDARIRFVPQAMDSKTLEKCFEFMSLAAFIWTQCLYVGEELADVTTPSKAANGWGTVLRRGRKRGVKVMGVSQRPAESDKTIFTQAKTIRCGRLDGEGDIARIAANMRVPKEMISQLGELQYLELDRPTGVLKAGYKNKSVVIRNGWNEALKQVTL